ncbi:MAG: hypothetical protein RJQ14_11730, partial [Marinoscillum sp.]
VDDYLTKVLGKGSNKFLISDYQVEGTKNLDVATTINYTFNIKDYYSEVGDKIYLNMVLDQSLIDGLIEKREVPIENDYLYSNESISVLEFPEGVSLQYLPPDEAGESEFFSYTIKYKQVGNQVVAKKFFKVNYLTLNVDQFDSWNEIIKQYSKACRNVLILNKNNN